MPTAPRPRIIGFARRLVTITDWFFTVWGILLLVGGGFGAAWVAGIDPLAPIGWSGRRCSSCWREWSWLFLLVPIQLRQARLARASPSAGRSPRNTGG